MDNETQELLNELLLINIKMLQSSEEYRDHRLYRIEKLTGSLLKKLYPGRSPQRPESNQFKDDYRDFLVKLRKNLSKEEKEDVSNLPSGIPEELFEL